MKIEGEARNQRTNRKRTGVEPAQMGSSLRAVVRARSPISRLLLIEGFVSVVVIGSAILPAPDIARSAGVAVVVGMGACAVGSLLGFIFGLPRSDSAHVVAGAVRPNTNLERVSDWLTKILVGVGLTQLYSAPAAASSLVDEIDRALGQGSTGRVVAGALILYFVVAGFATAWLVTRLHLGGAMQVADAESLRDLRDLGAAVADHLQDIAESESLPDDVRSSIATASQELSRDVVGAADRLIETSGSGASRVSVERTLLACVEVVDPSGSQLAIGEVSVLAGIGRVRSRVVGEGGRSVQSKSFTPSSAHSAARLTFPQDYMFGEGLRSPSTVVIEVDPFGSGVWGMAHIATLGIDRRV